MLHLLGGWPGGKIILKRLKERTFDRDRLAPILAPGLWYARQVQL